MFWRSAPRPPLIRELRPADATAAAALHGRAFARGWSAAEIERMAAEQAIIGHLAQDPRDVSPIGFSLSRQAGDEGEVLSIAVSEAARRRGVGAALIRAQLSRLAARGTRRVFLEVEEGNAAARALYARFGFAPVGRRPAYHVGVDGKRLDALILRRDMD